MVVRALAIVGVALLVGMIDSFRRPFEVSAPGRRRRPLRVGRAEGDRARDRERAVFEAGGHGQSGRAAHPRRREGHEEGPAEARRVLHQHRRGEAPLRPRRAVLRRAGRGRVRHGPRQGRRHARSDGRQDRQRQGPSRSCSSSSIRAFRWSIYCNGGDCDSSQYVGLVLRRFGFANVNVFEEGYPSWEKAGYPVEQEIIVRPGASPLTARVRVLDAGFSTSRDAGHRQGRPPRRCSAVSSSSADTSSSTTRSGSRCAIKGFKFDLPDNLLVDLSFMIPWAEVLAGLCLIFGFFSRGAAFVIALMMAAFIIGIASVICPRDLDSTAAASASSTSSASRRSARATSSGTSVLGGDRRATSRRSAPDPTRSTGSGRGSTSPATSSCSAVRPNPAGPST